MQTPESRITPIGYRNNSCGYCKNKSGSFSYYATSKCLTSDFYQGLVNRGWRRSGTLLYKPDLRASCCPHYSIRLDSHGFKATKDQRQAVNRFNNYVLGEEYIRKAARYYPKSRQEVRKKKQVFDVVERVHEPEMETLTTTALQFANSKPKPPQPLKPAHDLTVTLEPDSFTEEKYVIFENYQRMIHKEPPSKISKYGFKNFLCSSPIRRSTFTWENGQRVERKLGSYHQCYRLDGKLIAVGVLDLLPQCVSAVYFMYHQDAIQWNFGKLGALRETSLALEFDYRYYYMGFYIHSCIKMRYKGDYHPQYVLDPRTHTWDLFDDDLRRKMDAKKFVCLSEERERPMINGNPDGNSEAGDNHANGVKDLSVDSSAMDEGEDKDDEMETVSSSSSSNSFPPDPPSIPLFSRNMPGILSRDELLNPPPQLKASLDDIILNIRGQHATTSDLVAWEDGSVDRMNSVKGLIGDLVAAVGWELAVEMVVSFTS